jgi:signal transduction protein with GAF and PtsI domain
MESILTRTNAAGVYLYAFHRAERSAELLAWSGAVPGDNPSPISGSAVSEHLDRESPIVLHDGAWTDSRFRYFPEFITNEFRGVVSIPLLHSDEVRGLLQVCRREPAGLAAADATALFSLSEPVGALLEASWENTSLRRQVETLSRNLADRKILDRAKGILQARFSWTEEEAYLHLRRTSRQRRTAMREIAMEVIKHAETHPLEVRRAS